MRPLYLALLLKYSGLFQAQFYSRAITIALCCLVVFLLNKIEYSTLCAVVKEPFDPLNETLLVLLKFPRWWAGLDSNQ